MKILHRIGLALGITPEPEADSSTLIIDDEVDSLPTTGHISILPGLPATVGRQSPTEPLPVQPATTLVEALRSLFNALEPEVKRAVMPEAPSTIAHAQSDTPATDEAAEAKRLRADLEQSRLSADRQRRALSDRINALQSQVTMLEEKNERMALAAARHPAEADALDKIKRLEAENSRLKTLNEQLDTKSRLSDKMMSDLQSAAANARKEAERLTQQLAPLQEKLQKQTAAKEELEKQLEERIYNQTHNENKLKRRIRALEEELATDPDANERQRSRRRKEPADPKPVTPDNDPDSQLSLF